MSAEVVDYETPGSPESLVNDKYAEFIMQHSPSSKAELGEYMQAKRDQAFSGEPTWVVRNPSAYQDSIYNLYYRQIHLGSIEMYKSEADVLMNNPTKNTPELIDTYDSSSRAINVIRAKELLEAHVTALKIIETTETLDSDTVYEYDVSVASAREKGEEVFEIVIPDDISELDPKSFEVKYSIGEDTLGRIVYDNELAEVYAGFGDFAIIPTQPLSLPRAVQFLKENT